MILAVRPVDPADSADLGFGVSAAGASNLTWSEETTRAYAEDPDTLIWIVEGTWPELGYEKPTRMAMVQAFFSKGGVTVNLLAIDPAVVPDVPENAAGRREIINALGIPFTKECSARGVEKVAVVPVPKQLTKLHAYLDELPQDRKVDDGARIAYTLDVAALEATFQKGR